MTKMQIVREAISKNITKNKDIAAYAKRNYNIIMTANTASAYKSHVGRNNHNNIISLIKLIRAVGADEVKKLCEVLR